MDDIRQDSLLSTVPEIDGYKVLDPCVLYAKLGQGGMGAVYRGRHLNLGIEVAVKCLKKGLASDDPAFVTRFQREAKVAAAINDSHLVRVFDVREARGLHYLVMEYVDGENARERVTRKGPLAPDEAATLILGAAKGVAAAHAAGVVHRDIKPDNVLIATDGSVKVADLGLARAAQAIDSVATASHMVMGTPSYMPPEQFEGAAKVGKPSDVYALGATLWFLLAGRNAIEGGSLTEVMRRVCLEPFPDIRKARPGLPDGLLAVLDRATRANPTERHADAAEFAREVATFVGGAGAARLADPAAGDLRAARTLVSPPPQDSLTRMRTSLVAGAATARRTAAPIEAVTDPRPDASRVDRSRASTPPRRRRIAAAIALGLVIVAAAIWIGSRGGHGAGASGGDRPDPVRQDEPAKPEPARPEPAEPEPARPEPAKPEPAEPEPARPEPAPVDDVAARLTRAESLAASAATLDDAILAYERLRADHPEREDARARLALLLRRRAARHRDDGRLGEAYADALEAAGLADDGVARQLVGELRGAVEAALRGAVEVTRPRDAIANRSVIVEGRVNGPLVATVQVNGRDAAVAAGAFDAAIEELAEGPNVVVITAVSEHGLRGEVTHAIVVDTQPPTLTVAWPAGALVPGALTLMGTVEDGTACTVDVNGITIRPDDTKWTTALELKAGANEIVVRAEDALGHRSAAVSRTLVATVPTVKVEPKPPAPPASRHTVGKTYRFRITTRRVATGEEESTTEGHDFTLAILETMPGGGARARCTYDRFFGSDSDEIANMGPLRERSFLVDLDDRGRITGSPDIEHLHEEYVGDELVGREHLADLTYAFVGVADPSASEWTRAITMAQEDSVLALRETCRARPPSAGVIFVSLQGSIGVTPTAELRESLTQMGAQVQQIRGTSNGSAEIATEDGLPKRVRSSLEIGLRIAVLGNVNDSFVTGHLEFIRLGS